MAGYQDLFGFDRFMQAQQQAALWDRQREQDQRLLDNDAYARRKDVAANALLQMETERKVADQNALRYGLSNQPYLETLRGDPSMYNEAQALNRQFMADMNPLADAGTVAKFGGDRMETEAERAAKTTAKGTTPYFTVFDTPQGKFRHDARTGNVEPVEYGGQQLYGASVDPALQRDLAAAKSGGKYAGEDMEKAKVSLPRYETETEKTIKLVDDLVKHPGFTQAVGMSSLLGVQKVPGTEARAFTARLDQLKGKQFLQAFESLKGGGQITEIEGQKATQSLARMEAASTEDEFKTAAAEFQQDMKDLLELAKSRAGQTKRPTSDKPPAPAAAIEYLKQNPKFKGAFKAKYGYLPEGI